MQRYCKAVDCRGGSRHQVTSLTVIGPPSPPPVEPRNPLPPPSLHTPASAAVAKIGDTLEMLQHRFKYPHQAGATSTSTLSIPYPLRDHSGPHNWYDTTVFHVPTLAHLPPMNDWQYQLCCRALNTDFDRIQFVAHGRNPTPQLHPWCAHPHISEPVKTTFCWVCHFYDPRKNNTSLTVCLFSYDPWPQLTKKKKKKEHRYILFCVSICPC